MKKRFPVALVASLLLTSGASTAFAATSSGCSTTTSTAVPATSGNTKQTRAQREAQIAAQQAAAKLRQDCKAELVKYLETKKAIITNFQTAITDARKAFKAALESATTREARKAAIQAQNDAFKSATEAKNAALAALGAPPATP
jgi:hypothetical protein